MLDPTRWKSLHARYKDDRPRHLLSLDGGGIRGLITLGILERLEALIKQRTGKSLPEYRMATEPAYRLSWSTGEDRLLLVSIGTGAAEHVGATAAAPNANLFSIVKGLPGDLMYGMLVDLDINCRTVGRCTHGAYLDREILDLVPRQVHDGMTMEAQYQAPLVPLSTNLGRRFLYVRYNADLSEPGLTKLGFPDVAPGQIQRMDAVENVPRLLEIGRAAGRQVDALHLGPFV